MLQAAGFDPPSMRWDESNLPEQWETFERHAGLVFSGPLKGKEEKVSFLLLLVGDKGWDIRHTWTDISDADSKKLDTFYKRFKEHVQPTLNPIFARYQFNNEKQGLESVDSFITRLRLKARDCEFENQDAMIRDKLIFGTNSDKIREKLINVGRELTLTKAIQIAQSHEYAQEQMREMSKSDDVHMVRQGKAKRKSKFKPKSNIRPQAKGQNQTTQGISPQETCGRCGNKHSKTEVCKAKRKKCYYCHRRDHFERVCKFKQSKSEMNDQECDSDESNFCVDSVQNKVMRNNQTFVEIQEGPKSYPISFKVATGSQVNILPSALCNKLNIKTPLRVTKSTLTAYDGSTLTTLGTVKLRCKREEKIILDLKFHVV